MPISVTPIPRLINLTAPSFTLGTSNAAGSSVTAVASDSTLLAFDGTLPAAVGTPSTGSAVVTSRRDHVHGGVTSPVGGNLDLSTYLLVGNGGSTGLAVGANGEVTSAVQPSFLAYTNVTLSNVTGDGTVYPLVTNVELWDLNGDYDGTSTFTAPITGKYMMVGRVTADGNTSGIEYGTLTLDASNRDYELVFNAWNISNGSESHTLECAAIVDMDASDTCIFKLTYDGGSKVIDLLGHATTPKTSFSGWLLG